MVRSIFRSATSLSVGSLALVSVGVAGNPGLEPTLRTIPAVLLIAGGLSCIATVVGEYPADRIRRWVRRWWLVSLAAFLPYGLAAAPASDSAKSIAGVVTAAGAVPVLEAVAGATLLCAVTVTVVYGFAAYGVHPGARTPEERVLDDGTD